jgi:hypothetical protein
MQSTIAIARVTISDIGDFFSRSKLVKEFLDLFDVSFSHSLYKFTVVLVFLGPEIGPHRPDFRFMADSSELQGLSFVKICD